MLSGCVATHLQRIALGYRCEQFEINWLNQVSQDVNV